MIREAKKRFRELLLNLSPREQRFVTEYCSHENASLAARRAGYSERSAGQIGHEILKRHEIAEAIQAGTDAYIEQCQFSEESVIQRLADIASSDLEHFEISEEGQVCLREGAPLTSLRAVQGFTCKKTVAVDPDGNTKTTYHTTLRLWDKIRVLELIGRRLKMFVDRVETTENAQDVLYRELLKSLKEKGNDSPIR